LNNYVENRQVDANDLTQLAGADMPHPVDVLDFWRNASPAKWFARDAVFDQQIRDGFEAAHMAASRGEFAGWEATAEGSLALMILLDQFPRNIYRGSAHAFATDGLARRTTRAALAAGFERQVEPAMRFFFYMPLEHSEEPADQDHSVRLFRDLQAETGEPGNVKWAELHRDIILRFGRFPHRNQALGRDSTPEEVQFLAEGGFSG
jgi:uncharacterized protein (DUF924 family)